MGERSGRRGHDSCRRPSRSLARHDLRALREAAGMVPVERGAQVAEVIYKARTITRTSTGPLRTRRREYGIYAEEVLAVYAPFALGGDHQHRQRVRVTPHPRLCG